MKITDLTVTMFNWESPAWKLGPVPFGGKKLLGLVTVHTDEGLEGNSFLGSTILGAEQYVGPMMELVKPLLMGCNPLDIGDIWTKMWKLARFVSTEAIGAVDVALWDLAGKAAGLPIHRLLGSCRTEVPAYGSSGYHQNQQDYVEEALNLKGLGWGAYKIHPHGDPAVDIAICSRVREAVGDGFTLMLDSVWRYCYEQALRVGRAIEELGYYWYEDPLMEDDIYNFAKLREKLDIPIMSTEFAPGRLYGLAQWISTRATDMLRGDVAVFGGITAMVKVIHLAEAFRMRCEVHHGGNSLNNAAGLNLIMATHNCEFFEVFPARGSNKYGLVEDIEVDEKGLVHAPEKPGLGFEVDMDLVKRETVQVVR